MLINKRYPLKVNRTMVKRYINFGYNCKAGDTIYVLPEEISNGSRTSIELFCDYCLNDGIETLLIRPYFKFVNGRKNIDKDACNNCKLRKTQDILKVKYGVSHQGQLESVKKALSDAKRLKFYVVQNLFRDRDYLLLSIESEYKSNATRLKYLCLTHVENGVQYICYGNLSQGIGCYHCGRESAKNKLKFPFEFVHKEFSKNNLTLIDTEYTNSLEKLKFICNAHTDRGFQYTTFTNLLDGHRVCHTCYIDSKRGDNCNFWSGGTTELLSILRCKISDWKIETLKKDNYTCVVTGAQSKLHIHHLYSFHKIVKESLGKLNLLLLSEVKDYTSNQIKKIEKEVIRRHSELLGVCLVPEVHKLYHQLYGNDNTPEQFEEFKIRYKFGEFDTAI